MLNDLRITCEACNHIVSLGFLREHEDSECASGMIAGEPSSSSSSRKTTTEFSSAEEEAHHGGGEGGGNGTQEHQEKRLRQVDERSSNSSSSGSSGASKKPTVPAVVRELRVQLFRKSERVARLESRLRRRDAEIADLRKQVEFLERALLGDQAADALRSAEQLYTANAAVVRSTTEAATSAAAVGAGGLMSSSSGGGDGGEEGYLPMRAGSMGFGGGERGQDEDRDESQEQEEPERIGAVARAAVTTIASRRASTITRSSSSGTTKK